MTTSQHNEWTPGPWTVITTTTDGFYISGNRAADPVTEARHLFVAVVRPVPPPQPLWNEITWQEAHANARLIAAAPKLLEVLEAVVKIADRAIATHSATDAFGQFMAVAVGCRKAITAATKGEQS